MTEKDDIAGEEPAAVRPGRKGLPSLQSMLAERYGEFRQRLARRLGSLDLAEEALQDAFLRLDKVEAVGELHNPGAYIFRAAFNIGLNRNRSEKRRLKAAEVDALLHVADDAPDAQRIIESRSDLETLKRVMAELPERQRMILLAARLEGLSRQEIAARFGISVSMVEKEFRKAQEYCVTRFRRRKG